MRNRVLSAPLIEITQCGSCIIALGVGSGELVSAEYGSEVAVHHGEWGFLSIGSCVFEVQGFRFEVQAFDGPDVPAPEQSGIVDIPFGIHAYAVVVEALFCKCCNHYVSVYEL